MTRGRTAGGREISRASAHVIRSALASKTGKTNGREKGTLLEKKNKGKKRTQGR